MGRIYEASRTYQADVNTVGDSMSVAFASVGAKVDSADEASGTVTGSRSVGLASWGERITARVTAAEAGTNVTVESKLKFGLVDWGRNRKNVEGILDTLGGRLS